MDIFGGAEIRQDSVTGNLSRNLRLVGRLVWTGVLVACSSHRD